MPKKTLNVEKLAFDEALEKLENVITEMEAGDLPLESLTERFDDGIKLLLHCQGKLDCLKQRIDILDDINAKSREKWRRMSKKEIDAPPVPETQSAPVQTGTAGNANNADAAPAPDEDTLF